MVKHLFQAYLKIFLVGWLPPPAQAASRRFYLQSTSKEDIRKDREADCQCGYMRLRKYLR
jgi:hypothetical protein